MAYDCTAFHHQHAIRVVRIPCFPLARQCMPNISFSNIMIDMIAVNHGFYLVVTNLTQSVRTIVSCYLWLYKGTLQLQARRSQNHSDEIMYPRCWLWASANAVIESLWRCCGTGLASLNHSVYDCIHSSASLGSFCLNSDIEMGHGLSLVAKRENFHLSQF